MAVTKVVMDVLAGSRPTAFVKSVEFSGPQTATYFGNRLIVCLHQQAGVFALKACIDMSDRGPYSKHGHVDLEGSRLLSCNELVPVTMDLDGNPFEIEYASEEAAALIEAYFADKTETDEDPEEDISAAQLLQDSWKEAVSEEDDEDEDVPVAAEAATEVHDEGDTEDYGFDEEGEEESDTVETVDEETEEIDLEAMDRDALTEMAKHYRLRVHARTSDLKLRQMLEVAITAEMEADAPPFDADEDEGEAA